MEMLIEKMQKLLASSFAMYLKAHQFHWNVEGQDFHQYHSFFGELYEEVWNSVDTTAEQIRALGARAKGSLADYKELSAVGDQMTQISLQQMNVELYRDNETILSVLNEVHEEAEKLKAYGLLNYIEGRIDTHKKHSWMLRASRPVVANEDVVVTAQPIEEEIKTYIFNPSDC